MDDKKRLFFGLELNDQLKQQIIDWRARTFPGEAGKPVAADSLHLTLAFLGEIGEQKAHALRTLAGRISQSSFLLTLDDAGHWPRAGVVWLGPRQAPRGMLQLAEMLRSQAARSGCYQSPRPFHPHVTLLRNATAPVMLPPRDFGWSQPVNGFALFASHFSRGRSRYEKLEEWPLR